MTADTVVVKATLVAPADTVTEAGTPAELLLVESATVSPPDGAAEANVAVQASVPAPVSEELVQERELRVPAGDCP